MNKRTPFKIFVFILNLLISMGPLHALGADIPGEPILVQVAFQPNIVPVANTVRRGLTMNSIMERSERQGYSGVSVHDSILPGLAVKACKKGKALPLGINRWGDILWQQIRGIC